MEPRIIKGHRFLCKKDVVMNQTKEKAYTKGKVYEGCPDCGYPGDKHNCGFISNNKGVAHAWPYDPQNHLWCHDSWTEFFDDLDKDKNETKD